MFMIHATVRPAILAAILLSAAPAVAQPAATGMARTKLQADAEAEFARVDVNKDGQMSRTEIETFQTARLAEALNARTKAVFAELDSDKNGQLSAAEFARLNPPRKADAASVLTVDSNKDGQVSLAEHRTAALKTFDDLDANKNGILTPAEVDAARAKAR
jgi:Ca2+-binding EF-hand superfamily protein